MTTTESIGEERAKEVVLILGKLIGDTSVFDIRIVNLIHFHFSYK